MNKPVITVASYQQVQAAKCNKITNACGGYLGPTESDTGGLLSFHGANLCLIKINQVLLV